MSGDVTESERLPKVEPMRERVSVREFLRARTEGRFDIESRFFSTLRVAGGVYKSTSERRLDDTTAALLPHVTPSGPGKVRVLDVGCSSGVTTVELFEALRNGGIDAEVVGTDRVVRARYVERADGSAVLFDARGELLQIDIGEHALPAHLRYARRAVLRRPLTAARALWLRSWHLDAFRRANGESPAFRSTEIALVSGRVQRTPQVTVIEEDMRSPQVVGRFDVIRAANVLNLSYHDEAAIAHMVEVLGKRLVQGGLFLVARTVEGTNHATLFRREDSRFRSVDVLRLGTEITRLVLGATIAA
jgi:SAM-dependent methyltransferase